MRKKLVICSWSKNCAIPANECRDKLSHLEMEFACRKVWCGKRGV